MRAPWQVQADLLEHASEIAGSRTKALCREASDTIGHLQEQLNKARDEASRLRSPDTTGQ